MTSQQYDVRVSNNYMLKRYPMQYLIDFARAHPEHESDNMALTSVNKYLEQHSKTLKDYHLLNVAITLGTDDTY